MREYITFSGFRGEDKAAEIAQLTELIQAMQLTGTEVFIAHLVSRDLPLFESEAEKAAVMQTLQSVFAKRIHLSYWAEPTDFLENVDRGGLMERFGDEEKVKAYYSDLDGEHIFKRWIQEYQMASEIGAEAVTFHVIDYFHIDGEWEFTNSREVILEAMIKIVQRFLDELDAQGMLENGPVIELENAGFGLEYGAQRADDFVTLLENIHDRYQKVKIGWDTNHLLHATGFDESVGRAKFFLPEEEKTPEMIALENQFGDDYIQFCANWLRLNILDPRLVSRIGSIHVSDAPKKTVAFFEKGKLQGSFSEEMQRLKTDIEKEDFGVKIVLEHYDSHTPFTFDTYDLLAVLQELSVQSQAVILHELKNNEGEASAFEKQQQLFAE